MSECSQCRGRERPATMREIRKLLGKTQAEVATEFGGYQPDVSRLERTRDPMLSSVRRYATGLGVRCEVAFVLPDGRRVLITTPSADEE